MSHTRRCFYATVVYVAIGRAISVVDVPTITLKNAANSGVEMPVVGLGTVSEGDARWCRHQYSTFPHVPATIETLLCRVATPGPIWSMLSTLLQSVLTLAKTRCALFLTPLTLL